jgi:hypothetical protein
MTSNFSAITDIFPSLYGSHPPTLLLQKTQKFDGILLDEKIRMIGHYVTLSIVSTTNNKF